MTWYQRPSNKYGNKKTKFNGRFYDSKHEASVASEIDFLVKAGEVLEVQPQRTYPLHGKNGTRVCDIRVDFWLRFRDGHEEVWEAKSPATMTQVWHLKRKLWEAEYEHIGYVVITSRGWWTPRKGNRTRYN